MRVVAIGRTKYAIGLWWQIEPTAAQSSMRRARRHALTLGAPLSSVVVRDNQYGFGQGAKRLATRSLAACLARRLPSALAVCMIEDNLWWVFAAKNGIIAAEGDWIGESWQAAVDHAAYLRQVLNLPEAQLYPTKDAAASWIKDSLGSDSRSLRTLWLMDSCRLRPLNSSRSKIAAVLALFAVVMLYHAGFFSTSVDVQLALAARRLEIMAHPDRYFVRPWMNYPPPTAWSSRCLQEILALPVIDQGWEFDAAVCVDDSLTTQWKFSPGASFLHLPQGAELFTPTMAQRVQKLPKAPSAPDTKLRSRDENARMLYEVANILGLELQLTWNGKSTQTYQEGSLSVALTSPWQEGRFAFSNVPTLLVLDGSFYAMLENIPGLVLKEMSHRNEHWELKGLTHAR